MSDRTKYWREWKRKNRVPVNSDKKCELLTARGKCCTCEMLLQSSYHTDCPGVINRESGQLDGQSS